jgi:hypothetical protein
MIKIIGSELNKNLSPFDKDYYKEKILFSTIESDIDLAITIPDCFIRNYTTIKHHKFENILLINIITDEGEAYEEYCLSIAVSLITGQWVYVKE